MRDIVVCEQVCISDAERFVPRNRSRFESLRRKEGFRLIDGRPNEWCRMQYAPQHFGTEQAGITPQGAAVL